VKESIQSHYFLMIFSILSITLISGCIGQVITTKPETTTITLNEPPDIDISQIERDVFDLVNAERVSHGLKPLIWNDEIVKIARLHSEDMAELNYFAHVNLDGLNVDDRLKKEQIYYWDTVAENIFLQHTVESYTYDEFGNLVNVVYKNQTFLTKETVDGWLNSIGHKENMLKPEFNEAGVGIAEDLNGTKMYITLDFIIRVDCGYKGGPCCEKPGYLPSCYVPHECVSGICE